MDVDRTNSYDCVISSGSSTVTSVAKQARLDIRVTQEQKQLLEQAAQLKGLSLSAYVLSHSLEAARDIVESHERIVLSDRDRQLFMDALSNPPEPTSALRSVVERYRSKYER